MIWLQKTKKSECLSIKTSVAGLVIDMPKVLVIGDEKDLGAALKKHGAENVWWAVREGPTTRPVALRVGLAPHHYAGLLEKGDCSEEDYDVVVGGEPKPEPKKESKPAAKKKAAKKDD